MKRKSVIWVMIAAFFLWSPAFAAPPYSTAKSAIMLDEKTGGVMWAKNADAKIYPASTTKLMTAILYYEANQDQLDRKITVDQTVNQTPPGSSIMGLKVGDVVTAKDLLYGLMLPSGNDAALVAAADHSGSVGAFVEKMNEKAKSYGMTNTHFVNPHGFHDDNHYTTARDFAILARRYEEISALKEIASTKTYVVVKENTLSSTVSESTSSEAAETDANFTLVNTNHLLGPTPSDQKYYYALATGIKTGYHDQAGYCLISAAAEQEQKVIVAAFGYPDTQTRFTEAKTLLEYGLKGFVDVSAREYFVPEVYAAASTNLGLKEYNYGVLPMEIQVPEGQIKLDRDVAEAMKQGRDVKKVFRASGGLSYPLKAGQTAGQLDYVVDGNTVYTARVTAAKDLERQQIPGMITGARHAIRRSYDKKSFVEGMIHLGLDLKGKER